MNVRSAEGLRRHYRRQNERRKLRNRCRALAALENPVSLILEADGPGRVPISFLSLHELKARVQELNLALELAKFGGIQVAGTSGAPRPPVCPAQPPVAKKTIRLPLDGFERGHKAGRATYDYLVRQAVIAPAVGEWSSFKHDDLVAALPEIKFKWGRQRRRYLVRVVRDSRGGIEAIQAFSMNYWPIIELRTCPSALIDPRDQAAA